MKNLALISVLLICIITMFGCSSGGSSNPVAVATAPSIVSISPQNGGPGTLITIQGNRFGLMQGNSIVSYAGVTVIPTSWSDTQIKVTIPETAQSGGSFIITVGGVASNNSVPFALSNPIISYLSPQTANPGTEVTISGQYFGSQKAGTYVTFNSQTAQILSWNETTIRCLVPALTGVQSGNISVVVWIDAVRYSNTSTFNLVVPTISSISPSTDNIGALVTILGQGFGASQNQVNGQITFGGVAATAQSWSENSIQVRVPQVAAAGSQVVSLSVNGRSTTGNFNVAGPTASSSNPSTGVTKNQLLTIYGSNFGNESDVVSRIVSIDTTGQVSGVTYADTYLSFSWPVDNTFLGTQNRTVTISIGGLTTTFMVVAD